MGWQLLRQGAALIIRDWRSALRVSVGPFLILIAISLWALPALGRAITTGLPPEQLQGGAGAARLLILQIVHLLGSFAVLAWIAVAWHRSVLLGEQPSLLPTPPRHLVRRYLGRFLLIALAPALIVLASLASVVLLVPAHGSSFPWASLAPILAYLLSVHVLLRLGVALPGTALARPLPLRDAWRVTGRHKGTLWALTGAMALLGVVNNLLGQATSWPGIVFGQVIAWATLMLGLSLLTALYGTLVEGRSLPS
jgi:hypothetical protein